MNVSECKPDAKRKRDSAQPQETAQPLRTMLKRLLIPIVILAVAVPLMAQGALQQKAQTKAVMQLRILKKALDLTPDQVNSLKALVQSNKAQRQAIAQDARQKAQTLRSLMAQSNPNPTDLGNAALALREARKRGQALREQTLNSFKSYLTPDQIKILEGLRRAGK